MKIEEINNIFLKLNHSLIRKLIDTITTTSFIIMPPPPTSLPPIPPPPPPKLNITKTLVNVANDKLSFILHDVFTEEECKEFFAEAERQGFEEAMVNNGTNPTLDKDFRKGGRCVIKSKREANEIWSRIKFYIPKQLPYNPTVLE